MKRTAAAALAYLVLSLILTWPLALGLARDVPGDLGDSLLNMWILAWGAEHVPQLLTGTLGWPDFWTANIFHPEPLTLALSEHLFGQTLQVLPVYWLTGNIILSYNLLFISTFVLSAFGTFLLVRDLTGSNRAAFIAGLIYGFLPYRIASVPHLQVLSSQWMPFALWGLNRFVAAGSRRGLAAGVGALVMQNWSCVYYLLFFMPFVTLFVLHRLSAERKLGAGREWAGLAVGALTTIALTVPFLLPYQQANEAYGLERSRDEVVRFSANLWSYATASENVRLWGGTLRAFPYAEGETFLGFVPWILAALPVGALIFGRNRAAADRRWLPGRAPTGWRLLLACALAVLAAGQLIGLTSALMFGGFDVDVLGMPIRARTPWRLLLQFLLLFAALLAVAPAARDRAARLARSPEAFFALMVLLAVWLSLGPEPAAGTARQTGFGLYGVLQDFVPGFNGLRVPARFAMIAGLFLAILAGYGARLLTVNAALVTAGVLVLAEGAAVPFELNRVWGANEAVPPARVYPADVIAADRQDGAAPVYARLAGLPRGTVITEFPFGDGAWEIRYVYYSAVHFHPITNGYSGGFPPRYKERVARLQRIDADPQAAWQTLRETGTTHVVVHRNAFANPANADIVEGWLTAHGAREIERFDDGAVLYHVAF